MKKFIFFFLFLSIFLIPNFSASAKELSPFEGGRKMASIAANVKEDRMELKASAAAAKQARKDALSEAKVAVCQTRQGNIQQRSSSIVERVSNQEKLFNQIAQRVEQYYNEKLLPSGKIVSNYNSLVSDIATKEAAIAPLLATASAGASNFSCDKDHPADQVLTFNQNMKSVLTALEAFRKSVRNLIVAVRTVSGTSDASTATGSAFPLTNK